MAIKASSRSSGESDALAANLAALTFGPFRIDFRIGQLFAGDRAVRLRPKTWAVLVFLAARPRVLVTRDEIFDAVWPDVAVTPDTLNKSIAELRSALGDDSRTPRFLETVHRRGFRFIAQPSSEPPAPADRGNHVAAMPIAERREATPACFVGREREMRTLRDAFAAALASERQMVFVSGPAGAGKTALVDAFLASRAVGELGMPVWIGGAGCVEQHGPQEPYMPVLDALQRLVRPPNVERMIALMRRAAPLWLAQMPWLLGETDAVALRHSLQGARPERMPRELANLVETLTADLTLVLVLEDLHWSDPATVDLLNLLAQRRDPARLLVIGTYRPADLAVRDHALAQVVRTLRTQNRCTELAVHDLTRDEVDGYLTRRFPAHGFPPTLADAMHAHTGGQPLFVVALTDQLLAHGTILDTAPGWALSRPVERIDFGVPDDVRQLLEGQFRDLDPGVRSVLEAASAAGEHVVASILAAALAWPVEDTERRCETLAQAQRFLRIAGTHQWPDGTRARQYAFTHELYRHVVYDGTPVERRARLHAGIGRALERAQGERVYDLAPQLATHFGRGDDEARTLRYLTVSGVRARERFASREALDYLEGALRLVDAIADPEDRRRLEPEVRLALGRVLGDLHGFGADAVRENYERVSALCALTQNATQAFEALYARWYLHALRAERAPATALADELVALATAMQVPGYDLLADSTQVRTAYYDGRFSDAVRHMASLRRHLAHHPATTTPIGYGVDPVLAASTHCAGALWLLGDAESARAMARDAVAGARASSNPFYLAAILTQTAQIETMIGHHATAAEQAAEAEALAAHQGFALWQAVAAGIKARAQAQLGEAEEGSRGLERALQVMETTGTRLSRDLFQAFLAEAYLGAGARAQGLAAAEAGLRSDASELNRGYAPELWRLKGELLLAPVAPRPRRRASTAGGDGDWAAAEESLLRAIDTARTAQAKSLELRAALSLARAWQVRRRAAEARDMLGAICDRFDPASSAPDLVAARTLRETLAAAG